jgi:hypothetical protein
MFVLVLPNDDDTLDSSTDSKKKWEEVNEILVPKKKAFHKSLCFSRKGMDWCLVENSIVRSDDKTSNNAVKQ